MTLRITVALGLTASSLGFAPDARPDEPGSIGARDRPTASAPAISPPAAYWSDGFSRYRPQRVTQPPVKAAVRPIPPDPAFDTKFQSLFNRWLASQQNAPDPIRNELD